MKSLMRKLHKWVGLIMVLQFVLWMASGLVMSLLDADTVAGNQHRAGHAPQRTWPAGTMAPTQVLAIANRPVHAIEGAWLRDRPVYRLRHDTTIWLSDARDGRPVQVDAAAASAIAAEDYVGTGRQGSPERLDTATLEVREHNGAIWRVPFYDEDATTLYISVQDGRILERRNDTWRLFDIAWMLHIMDYTGRQNFNNPMVIMAASAGLWIALTGLWLLVVTFRLREFVPVRCLKSRAEEKGPKKGGR